MMLLLSYISDGLFVYERNNNNKMLTINAIWLLYGVAILLSLLWIYGPTAYNIMLSIHIYDQRRTVGEIWVLAGQK